MAEAHDAGTPTMPSCWRVAVVGPGRAGTVVAAGLARGGHRVVGVAGGEQASRRRLRSRLPSARDTALSELAARSDLVVLAVPDDAIGPVVDRLAGAGPVAGTRLTHLSGARGTRVLAPLRATGWRVAATHPAITFPDPMADAASLVGMPWAVTAAPADRGWAREVVVATGGQPFTVAERDRATYHAGLAIASNAVGAAVAAALDVLVTAGVEEPARLVGPLAAASLQAALDGGAAAVTGPVPRGDVETLARHAAALDHVASQRWHLAMQLVLSVVGDHLDDERLAEVVLQLGTT